MNVKRLYAGLTGLVLAGGLAACGSAVAPAAVPKAAVTVTATPTPTVTVTPTPTPTVTKTKSVVVPPAPVYVPAAPALTDAGNGIFAGANTAFPFAQNVVSTWLASGAPSVFDAYSPRSPAVAGGSQLNRVAGDLVGDGAGVAGHGGRGGVDLAGQQLECAGDAG